MEHTRQRLLNESVEIKRSEEKRKERQNKKYGKQIHVEKQKERERTKRDMDERIKGLKRSKPHFWDVYRVSWLTMIWSGKVPWTTRRLTEISTLPLQTPFRIGPQNVPRDLVILAIQTCLAEPETVNLASEVLKDGQSKQ